MHEHILCMYIYIYNMYVVHIYMCVEREKENAAEYKPMFFVLNKSMRRSLYDI